MCGIDGNRVAAAARDVMYYEGAMVSKNFSSCMWREIFRRGSMTTLPPVTTVTTMTTLRSKSGKSGARGATAVGSIWGMGYIGIIGTLAGPRELVPPHWLPAIEGGVMVAKPTC